MEFEEREGTTFEEAERRYAELKRRHEAGEIDEEELDAERQRLVVRDDEGRWWAKCWETGEWLYHDGSAWIEGTPPVYRGVGSEDSPGQTVQRPATRSGSLTGLWIGAGISVAFVVIVLILVIANAPQTGSGSNPPPASGGETTKSKSSAKISVPDLGGKTLSQAAKAADDDFTIEVVSVDENSKKKGEVYDQDPDPKKQASKGSDIDVKVSGGKGKTKVPKVKGSSKSEAAEKIIDAGLDPKFDVEIDSKGNPKSSSTKVGKQSPSAGKEVTPGSFVNVE